MVHERSLYLYKERKTGERERERETRERKTRERDSRERETRKRERERDGYIIYNIEYITLFPARPDLTSEMGLIQY